MEHTGKHKTRTPEEKKKLMVRLNRVQGQIKGLQKMLEEDCYCPDMLIQVSAASSALKGFGKELLESHMKTCVVQEIQKGHTEVVEETMELIRKMM